MLIVDIQKQFFLQQQSVTLHDMVAMDGGNITVCRGQSGEYL